MPSRREYVVGDTVQLKSGGPEMTVKSVPTELIRYYTCQWFAGKKLEAGQFPFESLKRVEAKNKI